MTHSMETAASGRGSETRDLPPAESVREIACLLLGGIGDLLAATPTLTELKRRYPGAKITMVIRSRLTSLFDRNPCVDQIVSYDTSGWGPRLRFFRGLRATRFDLWIDLHTPTFHTVSSAKKVFLRNAIIMRVARTRNRLGYAVPILSRRLTHTVPVPSHDQLTTDNIVDTTLALLGPSEAPARQKVFEFDEADRTWAEERLPATDRFRLAFFFGGRQSANHWPMPRIVRFVEQLIARRPEVEIVLIGDSHEQAMAERLLGGLDPDHRAVVTSLIGDCTLRETAAAMGRCDAAVCTDSGPMHIADALGLPLVSMFAGKNYLPIWVPTGPRTRVLYHHLSCAPCLQSDCHLGTNECMDRIRAEEVLDALDDVLSA